MKRHPFPAALLCLLLLCSCARTDGGAFYCRVVLEEGPGFTCGDHVLTVPPGQDAVFSIRCADGYTVTGADCGNYALAPNANGSVTLTVPEVRYSTVVSLTVERSDQAICYDINDGSGSPPVEIPVTPSHLRWNTATDIFTRPGHTLIGWNTRSDGSGISVGLGSRVEPTEALTLYAQWSGWSPAELFRWREETGGVTVTAYLGAERIVTVPAELGGRPVRGIAEDAFLNVECDTSLLSTGFFAIMSNTRSIRV